MKTHLLSAFVVLSVLLIPTGVAWAGGGGPSPTYWQVASGDWGVPGNWDHGAPTASNDAYVDNNGTCTISNADPAAAVKNLYIGNYGLAGFVNMTGGNLFFSECNVGYLNTGEFTQSAGGVSGTTLNIGQDGGQGVYQISGGSLEVAGDFTIWDFYGKLEMTGSNQAVSVEGDLFAFGTLSYVMDAAGVNPISSTIGNSMVVLDEPALFNFDAMSTADHDIVLIDNYGTDSVEGWFWNLHEGDVMHTFSDGSSYTLTYVHNAGTDVSAANDVALLAHPVPEPTTFVLLTAGMVVGLFSLAKRKRR